MLDRVEAEQPLARPMDDRVGRHHLGIEPRAARQQAMEGPAMPVRPIHHRRNAKSPGGNVRVSRHASPMRFRIAGSGVREKLDPTHPAAVAIAPARSFRSIRRTERMQDAMKRLSPKQARWCQGRHHTEP